MDDNQSSEMETATDGNKKYWTTNEPSTVATPATQPQLTTTTTEATTTFVVQYFLLPSVAVSISLD